MSLLGDCVTNAELRAVLACDHEDESGESGCLLGRALAWKYGVSYIGLK